jgi:hypothetical protein
MSESSREGAPNVDRPVAGFKEGSEVVWRLVRGAEREEEEAADVCTTTALCIATRKDGLSAPIQLGQSGGFGIKAGDQQ